jgi:Ca-activated chloride channel family protein
MTNPSIAITALKPNAPLATAADLSMLLSIACPALDPSSAKARPRLNLALAIDRSGSMDGKPLAEAKSCAGRVVNSLREGDRIAIVAYDDRAKIIVRATDLTAANKAEILAALASVETGGNTNLHAGWLAAATEAGCGLAPDVLTRVVLLSDGQANAGITDVGEIARQAAALAERGIATSTIGLGHHFNEDLMTQLAQAGQGQANYGETAEDLWPSFEAEFGLLAATCGKDVQLLLASPAGGWIRVENGYHQLANGALLLPNLVYGGEVTALITLHVSGLSGAEAHLLQATVTYHTAEGIAATPLQADITLPLVPFADFVIGAPNPAVAERLKENAAAILQTRARAAARARDFAEVRSIADKLDALADGNAWLAGQAATMRELADQGDGELLSKEAVYASMKLRQSYAAAAAPHDAAEVEFLRRRGRQGKGV